MVEKSTKVNENSNGNVSGSQDVPTSKNLTTIFEA